jgi:hypothetical protein
MGERSDLIVVSKDIDNQSKPKKDRSIVANAYSNRLDRKGNDSNRVTINKEPTEVI